jgi:hypothetical protein
MKTGLQLQDAARKAAKSARMLKSARRATITGLCGDAMRVGAQFMSLAQQGQSG